MPELSDKLVYPLITKPGIVRDGAELDTPHYNDGVWVRFKDGKPKKIGGWREIANGLDGPIRLTYIHPNYPYHLIYMFSGNGVQVTAVDEEGAGGSPYVRTVPAFTAADKYVYTSGVLFDATGGFNSLVFHPGENLAGPDQEVDLPVYYGDVLAVTAFVSTGQSVSGGCVILQPFNFIYGSKGLIKNSAANKVADFATGDSNTANVAGTKIIRGLPIRGGSNAPSGLFWALDSLIRVSFVGGTTKWRYDTVADTTVLCQHGIISVDGVFYWIGVDRFLLYNGVVKELPNNFNQEYFFDNLNWNERNKVWATVIPRYGEIWWHFPSGDSTECDQAIIFNYREGVWYDTPVFRASGYQPRILKFPVWADSASNNDVAANKYRIYRQEFGVDSVVGENQTAIQSFFETHYFSWASGGPTGEGAENPNVQTRLLRVEPDFVQVGNMTVQAFGRSHAQAADVAGPSAVFSPTTGYVDIPTQQRLMRLRFESNVAGGNYWAGKTLLHLEPGDQRQ
jgi:hypothetical protein